MTADSLKSLAGSERLKQEIKIFKRFNHFLTKTSQPSSSGSSSASGSTVSSSIGDFCHSQQLILTSYSVV